MLRLIGYGEERGDFISSALGQVELLLTEEIQVYGHLCLIQKEVGKLPGPE